MMHYFSMGILMAKIAYWSTRYDISFQFWNGDNNVYISRDQIDIHSSGGYETIEKVLKYTIEWCEKTNPSFKYPEGIEITNPYAGT